MKDDQIIVFLSVMVLGLLVFGMFFVFGLHGFHHDAHGHHHHDHHQHNHDSCEMYDGYNEDVINFVNIERGC